MKQYLRDSLNITLKVGCILGFLLAVALCVLVAFGAFFVPLALAINLSWWYVLLYAALPLLLKVSSDLHGLGERCFDAFHRLP